MLKTTALVTIYSNSQYSINFLIQSYSLFCFFVLPRINQTDYGYKQIIIVLICKILFGKSYLENPIWKILRISSILQAYTKKRSIDNSYNIIKTFLVMNWVRQGRARRQGKRFCSYIQYFKDLVICLTVVLCLAH